MWDFVINALIEIEMKKNYNKRFDFIKFKSTWNLVVHEKCEVMKMHMGGGVDHHPKHWIAGYETENKQLPIPLKCMGE